MRPKHRILPVLMFLGLIFVAGHVLRLSLPGMRAEGQQSVGDKKVVAEVNGRPIHEAELKRQVERDLRRFRKYGMRKESPDLIERLRSRALEKLIGEELLSQASQKLKIEDIDKKVKEKIKALETEHGRGERFEKYMKMKGLTMEDLTSSLRARVYLDEYLKEKGISQPPIPEERIREAYESNRNSYSREETIKVSHILIAVDGDASSDEKDKALQEAKKVLKEIRGNKDFAEMAKKHSDCNSAPGGGSLGYIKKGYMPEEFDRVAFSMGKDKVSDVVETKFGYHIIKVFDKKSAGVAPYEEVRDFIRKFLQQQESRKRLTAHLAELKERAKIEILPEASEPWNSSGPRDGHDKPPAAPPQAGRPH